MIRKATLDDVDTVVGYGAKFHAVSPWADVAFDPVATGAFVRHLIENGAVFLSEAGMLGGMLTPLYFNPTVRIAAEMFWWAPSEGRALQEAFEAWAAEQGAQIVNFGSLATQRPAVMDRLYRRAGYLPTETSYSKRIAA